MKVIRIKYNEVTRWERPLVYFFTQTHKKENSPDVLIVNTRRHSSSLATPVGEAVNHRGRDKVHLFF